MARPSKREGTGGWASHLPIRLTDRDLGLLYLIGRCGIVTTDDVARMFFGSPHTARGRLVRLKEAGYLRVFVVSQERPNVYSLTAKGRRELLAQRAIEPSTITATRSLPRNLEHALGIVAVRVDLARAIQERSDLELVAFHTARELGHSPQFQGQVPDAIAVVRGSNDEQTIFVEVDAATETPSWLARKIRHLGDLRESGVPLYGHQHPIIVVLAPGLSRLHALARALVAHGVEDAVFLGDLGTVSSRALVHPTLAYPTDLASEIPNASVFHRTVLARDGDGTVAASTSAPSEPFVGAQTCNFA